MTTMAMLALVVFLAALFPKCFPFDGGLVLLSLLIRFQNQFRYFHGLTVTVDGNHINICPVDHLPGAIQCFDEGIYPNFHGRTTNASHLAQHHDHIPLVCRCLKLQIVNGSGGDCTAAVADGDDSCQFVDPF